MTLGEKLMEWRKNKGLSQEQLAEKLGLTRQSVSLWETDQTNPSLDNLVQLANLYHISLDQLVRGEGHFIEPTESNEYVVEYFETRKSIMLSERFFMAYPGTKAMMITYVLLWGIIVNAPTIDDLDAARNIALVAIILLVALVGILLLSFRKRVSEKLKSQTKITLTFRDQDILLEKAGIEVKEKYSVSYASILISEEREHYFLLTETRRRAIYVPKNLNSDYLTRWIPSHITKCVDYTQYWRGHTYLKISMFLVPLISLIFFSLSIEDMVDSSDLLTWALTFFVSLSCLILGLYGRKKVSARYWVFPVVLGSILCLFMLMGLVAMYA
ncbi:MAG: helix-turn-helix transcriptional regulator [Candidatus Izemoplasmatales bacterium]|nr:helix-turn-helix transcriptional regulator [Candidatus Izemoplasmatales bacterium]